MSNNAVAHSATELCRLETFTEPETNDLQHLQMLLIEANGFPEEDFLKINMKNINRYRKYEYIFLD